ncbi:MAG: tRNA pseudouridine(13) synthase TruD [Meiothermus sp.]|uniref:tRNA pseudouridine(13) synthase TruD n=1 Tax=Meiothermus sp. TaxID=1955249 RepID=UPI0025CC7CEB|nr:tRNA pseudouridine(13) synthase TruD [Meiothermus sp.]MCS7067456.1 tRNA pseudouridine(13) synthase TruD [Meiothermus sp.]MCX7600517.1 tRNA pseudouridine(13) synthase TruD [Meiothermus sp.]MDW8425406.1 tRNA pseudouridine(13) synthase TruD [Meiothermus sp.]
MASFPNLRFDFDIYPYLTPELPGVDGVIRHQPSDFQVYEVPAYAPLGQGEHLLVLIEKEGLTTRAVFEFIRDRLHINEAHIGVAGLKDKHALTRQWFSIPARYQQRLERLQELQNLRVLDWGLHPHKLRVGHLRGNRFRILIRQARGQSEPGPAGVGPKEQVEAILRVLERQGVPNYYGPQRFGLGGMNPVKGYELVKKGKVHSPSWLKKFLLASLQSLLFNDWLALRLEEGLFDKVIEGDIAKKHDTGGEFVVKDAAQENPRALRFEISATGALYGKKYREAEGAARALEDRILQKYELERHHFASRRGDRRLIRFPLTEAFVEEAPEGLWVGFFLPKGAYATAVLREVMKKNPEAGELESDLEETEA